MRTMTSFSEEVLELWNNWQIRGMVLLSLILQIILIMFGSRRKYIAKAWILILVWSAYLSADLVATVALGNLARSQGDFADSSRKQNNLIQAFWAPFLLLHLGGPDTITAYALEDNELWLRHLLNLVIQVGVAFYVLIRSWGSTTFTLLAILVFIAGIIKYGERNWVLKSSTSKQIIDSLHSVRSIKKSITGEVTLAPWASQYSSSNNYLHQAYYLFNMSKYLFQDLVLSFIDLNVSYNIISIKQSSVEAFKLVEVELGFIYDMLYTKAPIVYSKVGIFLRCMSFLSSITALIVFSIFIDKHAYAVADTGITYLVLVGATLLEVYAVLHFLFSDRTMIWLTKSQSPPSNSISKAIYSLYHSHFAIGKRWSGSMAQHNLIQSCFQYPKLVKFAELFGIDEVIQFMLVKWEEVNVALKDLIFQHLLQKGNDIIHNHNDANLREKLMERGDGVLERKGHLSCKWSTIEVEFNISLIIWHIATNFCYYNDTEEERDNSPRMKISKCLSDYMCYLLAIRPDMLPKGVGDTRYRYQTTKDEVKTYFQNLRSLHTARDAYQQLFALDNFRRLLSPEDEEGAKFMVFQGCKLAKQLQELRTEEKWETISEVWIEMLAYAASRCDWKEHAQQLRRGGELLTHVALLMAHLGLSLQYKETRVLGLP